MIIRTSLVTCIVFIAGISLAEEPARKVIEWGWDEPDTKFIRENIGAMEQHPFDLVLLDLRMPGLDGMMVLKTIKERWPESEVVIITGYPSIETAKEAVRLGAYNYLAKPLSPNDVVEAANGAMMKKRWGLHKASNEP